MNRSPSTVTGSGLVPAASMTSTFRSNLPPLAMMAALESPGIPRLGEIDGEDDREVVAEDGLGQLEDIAAVLADRPGDGVDDPDAVGGRDRHDVGGHARLGSDFGVAGGLVRARSVDGQRGPADEEQDPAERRDRAEPSYPRQGQGVEAAREEQDAHEERPPRHAERAARPPSPARPGRRRRAPGRDTSGSGPPSRTGPCRARRADPSARARRRRRTRRTGSRGRLRAGARSSRSWRVPGLMRN